MALNVTDQSGHRPSRGAAGDRQETTHGLHINSAAENRVDSQKGQRRFAEWANRIYRAVPNSIDLALSPAMRASPRLCPGTAWRSAQPPDAPGSAGDGLARAPCPGATRTGAHASPAPRLRMEFGAALQFQSASSLSSVCPAPAAGEASLAGGPAHPAISAASPRLAGSQSSAPAALVFLTRWCAQPRLPGVARPDQDTAPIPGGPRGPSMRLWTIQTLAAWEQLRRRGSLRGTLRCSEPSFRDAYAWMAAQMRVRLGPPPARCRMPVWAWYQWSGCARRKPDLRAAGHLPKGTPGVRLEIEAAEHQVLLSDFELWHHVLNYWYLPESYSDQEAFDAALAAAGLSCFAARPLPDVHFHDVMQASWLRIFDLDWSARGIAYPKPKKRIQATLWEIRLDQVLDAKHFAAR